MNLFGKRKPPDEGPAAQRVQPGAPISYQATEHHNGIELSAATAYQIPNLTPFTPVDEPPPARSPFLGRDQEHDTVAAGLAAREPIEISGSAGIGKTWLLCNEGRALRSALPDGVLYVDPDQCSFEEVRDYIFEVVYQPSATVPRSPGILNPRLGTLRLLVVIDNLAMPGDRLDRLREVLGESVLLVAADQPCFEDARRVSLSGLPEADALTLVQYELGRDLEAHEAQLLRDYRDAVDGHPMSLKRAARALKAGGLTPERLERVARAADPVAELDAALWEGLEDDARRILTFLRLLGGAPVGFADLAAIAAVGDVAPVIARLEELELAQTHSPRAGAVLPAPRPDGDDEALIEGALGHFLRVLPVASDAETLANARAIVALLELGAERGRWLEVLAVARVFEPALARNRRWGAWASALDLVERAATALDDGAQRSWVAHERGVRAVLLEEPDAEELLQRACELRRPLGDASALRVSEQTLATVILQRASDEMREHVLEPAEEDAGSGARRGATWAGALALALVWTSFGRRPARRLARRAGRPVLVALIGALLAVATSEGLRKKILDRLFGVEDEAFDLEIRERERSEDRASL